MNDTTTGELDKEIDFTIDHALSILKQKSINGLIKDNDYQAIFHKIAPATQGDFKKAFDATGLKIEGAEMSDQKTPQAIEELKKIFDRDGFINEEDYDSVCEKYASDSRTIYEISNWVMTNKINLKKKHKPDVSPQYKKKVMDQVQHPNVNKYSSLDKGALEVDYLLGDKRELEQAIKDTVTDKGKQTVLYQQLRKVDKPADINELWDRIWEYKDPSKTPNKTPSKSPPKEKEQEYDLGEAGEPIELVEPVKSVSPQQPQKASLNKISYNAVEILENILDNVQIIQAGGDVYFGDPESAIFVGIVWTDDETPKSAVYVSNMNKNDALETAFETLEEHELANNPELVEKLKKEHGQDWNAAFTSEWDGRALTIDRKNLDEVLNQHGIHIVNLHTPSSEVPTEVSRRESRQIRQAQMVRAKLEIMRRDLDAFKNSFAKLKDDLVKFTASQSVLTYGKQVGNQELLDQSIVVLKTFDDLNKKMTETGTLLQSSKDLVDKLITTAEPVLNEPPKTV
jgi:hypothetical protein